MDDIMTPIMGGVIAACALIFLISSIIKLIKRKKEEKVNNIPIDESPINESYEEAELQKEERAATVTKKRIVDSYEGVIIKSYVVDFLVTFTPKEGEPEEYSVTQELFDKVNEGDYGILQTVDGELYDFFQNETEEKNEDC